MRNRPLHDRLEAFSRTAAERLGAAIAEGAEIPFEVVESPGASSVLYRYRPLSGQFVRERMADLRAAEGYASVLIALSKLEGSSAYLRLLGQTYAPASERDRAEAVLTGFLARLFEDVTTFELEDGRFERTYRELESAVYEDTVVTTVLAPLIGVRLEQERWELGSGLALARGDRCGAPPEAVWPAGGAGGGPNALALLSVEAAPQEPPPLTAARLAFRKLLTALRLFKPGTVALGQGAWWRIDDGPWQSLELGFSGHPRSGEYVLTAPEREELVELFELVRLRPVHGAPAWALARFEMGCGQGFALDGLSDHLLALGALLDGDEAGPAGVPSRVAALCAEPADRERLRSRVEQAYALQRRLMRGELDARGASAGASDAPDRIAGDLENTLRAVLKDVVCGYLDPDVKHTADEMLRGEAEARPEPEPDPRSDPLLAFGAKLRGRGRRRKQEPVVGSWEEVVSSPEQPHTGGTSAEPFAAEAAGSPIERPTEPEPEFVVRRTKRAGLHVGRRAGSSEPDRAGPDADEQDTQETFAVARVREVSSEEDVSDWGFDDDPADYSAAV